jgi:protein SCO1
MRLRLAAATLCALLACVVAACTNGGGLGSIGGGGGAPSPFPSGGIGVGIPSGKIGVENDPTWGTISGYTQNQTSQVLAFPPGAKIAIKNLSTTTPHTLNVLALANGPPPQWPKSPSLSFSPSGNGILGVGYASGVINPGSSVMVTLSKVGTYLIGCAFHYVSNNMRDVIQVVAGATPGPTASPGPGGYARPVQPPKAAALAPQPHLVDQRGRSFTLASLRGKPLVITFIGAHCTDACPLINAQFSDVAGRIQREHLAARLLTITLDPEHDSPATMRHLAKLFDADPRSWIFAGGTVANVHAIMRSFGVISVQGKDGYAEQHTTFVYILNSQGRRVDTLLASSALNDDVVDALHDRSVTAQR